MGGVEFKIDSVNNKGQYSIDGGSTWQNFSQGVEGDLSGTLETTQGSQTATHTFTKDGWVMPYINNPSGRQYNIYLDITIGGTTTRIGVYTIPASSDQYYASNLYEIHAGDSITYTVSSGSSPLLNVGGYIYTPAES